MSDTIIKIAEKTENFTIIINEVAKRKDLSARAKGIYYYLMTLPKDWKLYKEELTTHFTEGKDAINTAFKELEKAGYITKTQLKKEGKFDGWEYKIFESIEIGKPEAGKPEAGKPEAGKPEAENPYTGNPQLLNTDSLLSTNTINNTYNKETPDKPAKRASFQKPSLDDVKSYCVERKNKVDPAKFMAYYESNGWKVGRNPMKDWRAAVRTWESNGYDQKPGYSKPLPVQTRTTFLDMED